MEVHPFGLVILPVIPVRAQDNDRSEMINQLLFGELVKISDQKGSWLHIQSVHDNYSGWVDVKQIASLTADAADTLLSLPIQFVHSLTAPLFEQGKEAALNLVIGTPLPKLPDGHLELAGRHYHFNGRALAADKASPDALIKTALLYLNAPYLWGGRSPFGIDCSGFMQVVFRMHGIQLPRDASQQALLGDKTELTEARKGDLAFFHNAAGKITHVGLLMENRQIIHASGQVRIDTLDKKGILHSETGAHSHQLAFIRRLKEIDR